MNKRICSQPECERTVRARGLCVTHYNQTLPNRHKKQLTPCAMCGAEVMKDTANTRTNRFCSLACRTEYQWQEVRAAKKQVVIYKAPSQLHKAVSLLSKNSSNHVNRIFVSTKCIECGSSFIDLYGSRACSADCQLEWHKSRSREGKHRRRARLRNAYVAPVFRRDIYLRDNFVCQLCNDPIDMSATAPQPLAPSIDHIIPLARGGTHQPSNVQAAHFLCNCRKSDQLTL